MPLIYICHWQHTERQERHSKSDSPLFADYKTLILKMKSDFSP